MAASTYLAIDLGASSGRHVAGTFDGQRLGLSEAYRFENAAVLAAGHLYWNLLALWENVCRGLLAAKAAHGDAIKSIGVDTWGVDFALLGRGDELLGNPYQYRDKRTDGMLERALQLATREEIFAQTGVQFLQINTLYQLLAMREARSPLLEVAETLLMMPDVFNWLLTGVKANEFTEATTTQFFDPARGTWSHDLLDRLGLPGRILGSVVQPGTKLGPLTAEVAARTGLGPIDVVLPGTHDTASAVMAVPASGALSARPSWCYISSGTWSLMGVEVPRPVINEQCLRLNFTNEGGVGGTIRLLKNISGLWLVQECRRAWNAAGRNLDWDAMGALAAEARPLESLINPDDASFLAPSDMPRAIADFCRRSGQTLPASEGAFVRCAIESLACRYRQVLGWLEELVGGRIETIHIVGGGTQNRQLCQATADACRRTVVAGPVEATAIGNVLMQAVAAGDISSIEQAREIVRNSFPVDFYEPRDGDAWDEAYSRFVRLAS